MAQRKQAILPLLTGIEADKLPIDADGKWKEERDFGAIKRLLNTFSVGTKTTFAAKIAAAPKPPERAKEAPPGGEQTPVPYAPPVFQAPEAGHSKPIRIRVGIQ